MEPALAMAALWGVFIATHIGFATRATRAHLVDRLGDWGFGLTYSAVAICVFGAIVHYYSGHSAGGLGGLAFADAPVARALLSGVIVLGVALAAGSFATYLRSPYAMISRQPIREPYGLERITRHPFMAGVALMAVAHVLLARWLVGTLFASGLALLAIAGAYHQDRKLLARKGAPYAAYLRATSAVPFVAIVTGRQRLVWRELPFGVLTLGVAIAAALRAVHGSIFAGGGAWAIAVVAISVSLIGVQTWLKTRRAAGAKSPPLRAGTSTSY